MRPACVNLILIPLAFGTNMKEEEFVLLVRWLLEHGWDYDALPSELRVYSRRSIQRAWNGRKTPHVASNTTHVRMALLEVDPPQHMRASRSVMRMEEGQ